MGTRHGRIARVNHHRRGVGSEAEMDRLETHAETQADNAESRRFFILKLVRVARSRRSAHTRVQRARVHRKQYLLNRNNPDSCSLRTLAAVNYSGLSCDDIRERQTVIMHTSIRPDE